jgi:hypothetical protein
MVYPCYIVDIDGTVSDPTHRRHLVEKAEGKKPNWEAFHAAAKDDPPIEHMCALVRTLMGQSRVYRGAAPEIVYVTGRPDSILSDTVQWLTAQAIFRATPLYMRKAGDYRLDYIIKAELLARLKADGFQPIMAFDDRKQVVQMWRQNGIPCLQVAEGDF